MKINKKTIYNEIFTNLEDLKGELSESFYEELVKIQIDARRDISHYTLITEDENLYEFLKISRLKICNSLFQASRNRVNYYISNGNIDSVVIGDYYNKDGRIEKLLFTIAKNNDYILLIIDFKKYFSNSSIYNQLKILERKIIMEYKIKDNHNYDRQERLLCDEIKI
jgi:hypothetical protein